ncbi:MAG: response regulator [Crocinitomicaceae bacterium]|nr:response regulator [Flavobacteriales bacterium]NQZ35618.1 response regulator [Crocinitomicaceae bacterium]
MKLYIVEDDPIAQRDLDAKLQVLGYPNCQFFMDAASAKKMIEEVRPDLMIVDIELGRGENGIELGIWLDLQSIPYFFLSGKQDVTTFFKTNSTKAYANIEKPISLSTLRNIIHATLTKKNDHIPSKTFVFLNIREREVKVLIEDIEYLKAARSYCDLKRKGKTKTDLISMPLQTLLDKFNHPHICRVHRSYAVNINHVMQRSGNLLFIGEELTQIDLSKSYKSDFEKLINQI